MVEADEDAATDAATEASERRSSRSPDESSSKASEAAVEMDSSSTMEGRLGSNYRNNNIPKYKNAHIRIKFLAGNALRLTGVLRAERC